jgi:hypothetical protein
LRLAALRSLSTQVTVTLQSVMSIEVVREAYDIAWDYLDRIGAIGDPEKAHVRLLASLLDTYNAGIKEQACHGQQGDYGIQ